MFKRIFGLEALSKGIELNGDLPSEKKVYGTFYHIAWPAAMEGLLLMLIASVDLMMVGYIGTKAVAAVGITSQPRMIILCFVRSLAVAITAIVARRKGEGRTDALNACLKQGFILTFIMSGILLVISLVFIQPILHIAGAKADYISMAIEYGRYNMIAIFFMGLAVGINAAHTGVGNTKIILYANVMGNVVNTILNFFLIYGIGIFPKLGVTGAGIATMIGSITAFGITLASVMKKDGEISFRGRGGWKFEPQLMRHFFNLGGSSFAEQIFERIGMFLYSYMVAQLGTVAFAAHYICMSILDIYWSFGQGMSKASSAMAGQKLGEGRKDLAYICSLAGRRMSIVLDIIAFCVFFFGRYYWMIIFSRDTEVIEMGMNVMFLLALSSFPMSHNMVYAGVLRGAGDTVYVAKYSFWDIAVLRPILTFVLCFPCGLGIYGAWIALVTDQTIRALCAGVRFHSRKWMNIRI